MLILAEQTGMGFGARPSYVDEDEDVGYSRAKRHYNEALGRTIVSVSVEDSELRLVFEPEGGYEPELVLRDEGQSCCEHRYMTTDTEDLGYYIGAVFFGVELKDATYLPSDYDEHHDIQFLDVHTSRGTFTLASHNEHNGYYGGFSLTVV